MSASNRKTAYSLYCEENIPRVMAAGEGLYTYEEVAEMVGLKPTHNFRRRVRELVASKKISIHTCFTKTGGLEHRFGREYTPEEVVLS